MPKTSKQFYTELGHAGLAERKTKTQTKKELTYLLKLLEKNKKILDLACGYGRFTIPLAKKGYDIEGIDITPALIQKAKETARKDRLEVKFRIGDMRKLPYENESFDSVICTWTAFSELYQEKDQVIAIKEILRALRRKGFAFIETRYERTAPKFIKDVDGDIEIRKIGKRAIVGNISGIETMPQYAHNKSTLRNLMKKSKVKRYKIRVGDFGGRRRLLLQFWKM